MSFGTTTRNSHLRKKKKKKKAPIKTPFAEGGIYIPQPRRELPPKSGEKKKKKKKKKQWHKKQPFFSDCFVKWYVIVVIFSIEGYPDLVK